MGKFSKWAKKLKPTPKPKETLAGKPVKERVSPRVHAERAKEKLSTVTSKLKRPVNTKTGKPFGVNTKDYVLKPKDIEFKGPENKFDGTYVKIDEEIRKLVKEKGINAFKDGGPVSIDNMLAAL